MLCCVWLYNCKSADAKQLTDLHPVFRCSSPTWLRASQAKMARICRDQTQVKLSASISKVIYSSSIVPSEDTRDAPKHRAPSKGGVICRATPQPLTKHPSYVVTCHHHALVYIVTTWVCSVINHALSATEATSVSNCSCHCNQCYKAHYLCGYLSCRHVVEACLCDLPSLRVTAERYWPLDMGDLTKGLILKHSGESSVWLKTYSPRADWHTKIGSNDKIPKASRIKTFFLSTVD